MPAEMPLTNKLQDRLTKIHARGERISNAALDENRPLSADERAEVARLLADFNNLGEQLADELGTDFESVSTVSQAGAWLNRPQGRKVQPERPRDGGLVNVQPLELAYGREPTFANMFGPATRDNGGFKSIGEFFAVAGSRRYDPRLRIMDASMSEGTGADGGYLVPPAFVQMLMDASLESEIVRPRASIVPMVGATATAAGFDTLNHTGGSIGGFTMEWLGELATGTRQKGKVRLIQLAAKKGAIFTQASSELSEDAPNFARDLEDTLIKAIGWSLDYYAINGTGAGQPLGVLNDPALVTVEKEGGQGADTLLATNVLKMYARMHPACIKNAVWMTSSTCIPQLATLFIESSTGGFSEPILKQQGEAFYMMGRPVILTEKLPSVGDMGDLMLVDWSQYALGLRKDITIERSNAAGWTEDALDWRAIIRVDGQGKWNAPVTPRHGDTLSWCVTLESR